MFQLFQPILATVNPKRAQPQAGRPFIPRATPRVGCAVEGGAGRNPIRIQKQHIPSGSKYLLRRCLGWVWRVQTPSEEVLGALGMWNKHGYDHIKEQHELAVV